MCFARFRRRRMVFKTGSRESTEWGLLERGSQMLCKEMSAVKLAESWE